MSYEHTRAEMSSVVWPKVNVAGKFSIFTDLKMTNTNRHTNQSVTSHKQAQLAR